MFNLKNTEKSTIFYYTGNWDVWNKPSNTSLVYITCIGGGGGGGGGASSTSQANNAGGGGASSPVVTNVYLASMLPDQLYVSVGSGGTSGTRVINTNGGAGGAGSLSYISVYPNTQTFNLVSVSAAGVAGGGGGGLKTSGGGAGGTAASFPTETNAVFMGMSILSAVNGQNGIAGTYANNATSFSGLTNSITCPGGGGGGSQNGSPWSGSTIYENGLSVRLNGGSLSSGYIHGANGLYMIQPFFTIGGSGGGGIYAASTATISGDGGNGSYGSGGGGGGGGALGGFGGRGGDGVVIISVR